MKSAVIFSLAGILVVVGAALALQQDSRLKHGQEVYATQKCALCHSISGIGGKKMPMDGVGSRLKPDDIEKWILSPKEMKADTAMKAYPNLPKSDLSDLVAYLMTLK